VTNNTLDPHPFDTNGRARLVAVRPAGLAVLLLMLGATLAAAQSAVNMAIGAYVDAVNDYVAMHRRIEKAVGPIDINSTPESINRSMMALAAAIRVERPDARQGEFFTPVLARELRGRINDALLDHGFTAADVYTSAQVEGIDPTIVRLRVNGTFPWVLGASMFPCVIEALPPLPPELQYRIVGNDLVLIDVHASLIVDILPNVLADLTVRNLRLEGAVR
jgi:hypothetical protein